MWNLDKIEIKYASTKFIYKHLNNLQFYKHFIRISLFKSPPHYNTRSKTVHCKFSTLKYCHNRTTNDIFAQTFAQTLALDDVFALHLLKLLLRLPKTRATEFIWKLRKLTLTLMMLEMNFVPLKHYWLTNMTSQITMMWQVTFADTSKATVTTFDKSSTKFAQTSR